MGIVKSITRMGHESLGTECSHPHCVVLDLGCCDRGPAIPHRARNLRAVFRQTRKNLRAVFAHARGRTAAADSQTLTGGAIVSLDYGSRDVHAALHCFPPEGWCPV